VAPVIAVIQAPTRFRLRYRNLWSSLFVWRVAQHSTSIAVTVKITFNNRDQTRKQMRCSATRNSHLLLPPSGEYALSATAPLVMNGVCVVGQQNADIADTLQLKDVAMATIFVFDCDSMAPPGEYD